MAAPQCWQRTLHGEHGVHAQQALLKPSLLLEHLTAYLVAARQLLQHQKAGDPGSLKITHVPREGGSAGPRNTQGLERHCIVEWLMPPHPWGGGRATEGFSLEAHEPPIPETWENNLFHLINSVPFFLPIPTPCCRSTWAQAPVSGVGGYIYFEIFHLMLFDHP